MCGDVEAGGTVVMWKKEATLRMCGDVEEGGNPAYVW
jgi:hypothetical protein